jgi:hypothetical protein
MGQEQFARNFAPLLKAKVANPPQQFPGPKRNVNLPYDWLTMDIGDETSIGLVGSVSFDSTRAFTLWGSGMDIGDTRDAFRFVYQTLSANGSIEVTVESHSAFASCAKAGIMLRENLSPSSPFVMLGLSPADGIFVQARQFNETQLFIKRKLAPPYRLRLIRKGDKWMTQIATQQQNLWETLAENTIRMARDVYLGLAVTSCDRSVVSVAKFANVVLQGGVNGGFYYRPLIIQQPS